MIHIYLLNNVFISILNAIVQTITAQLNQLYGSHGTRSKRSSNNRHNGPTIKKLHVIISNNIAWCDIRRFELWIKHDVLRRNWPFNSSACHFGWHAFCYQQYICNHTCVQQWTASHNTASNKHCAIARSKLSFTIAFIQLTPRLIKSLQTLPQLCVSVCTACIAFVWFFARGKPATTTFSSTVWPLCEHPRNGPNSSSLEPKAITE